MFGTVTQEQLYILLYRLGQIYIHHLKSFFVTQLIDNLLALLIFYRHVYQ